MALTDWLQARYATIGTQLEWESDTYDLIVEDTLEALDISAEGDVDAITLHKVAVYQLWHKALNDISLDITYSADGASFNRSDLHKQIRQNVLDAYAEAQSYLTAGELVVDWGDAQNPYRHSETRDNAGNY
jgi:hypothetical protein